MIGEFIRQVQIRREFPQFTGGKYICKTASKIRRQKTDASVKNKLPFCEFFAIFEFRELFGEAKLPKFAHH